MFRLRTLTTCREETNQNVSVAPFLSQLCCMARGCRPKITLNLNKKDGFMAWSFHGHWSCSWSSFLGCNSSRCSWWLNWSFFESRAVASCKVEVSVLFLVANLVTSSVALVTTSVALVPSSVLVARKETAPFGTFRRRPLHRNPTLTSFEESKSEGRVLLVHCMLESVGQPLSCAQF